MSYAKQQKPRYRSLNAILAALSLALALPSTALAQFDAEVTINQSVPLGNTSSAATSQLDSFMQVRRDQGWGDPDATRPGWGDPDATRPGWGDPDATRPSWGDPDATRPGWGDPDATRPGWGDPDAVVPPSHSRPPVHSRPSRPARPPHGYDPYYPDYGWGRPNYNDPDWDHDGRPNWGPEPPPRLPDVNRPQYNRPPHHSRPPQHSRPPHHSRPPQYHERPHRYPSSA